MIDRLVTCPAGLGVLAAGAGPTMVGYFLQGGLKFGGYELWKDVIASAIGAAAVARFAALVHMVPSSFPSCYFSSQFGSSVQLLDHWSMGVPVLARMKVTSTASTLG